MNGNLLLFCIFPPSTPYPPPQPTPKYNHRTPKNGNHDISEPPKHFYPVQNFALFQSSLFSAQSTANMKTRISATIIFPEKHDFPIEIITGKPGPLDPHPGDFQNLKIRIRTFEFLEIREHHPPTPNFALFPSKTLSAKVIGAISSVPRLLQSSP